VHGEEILIAKNIREWLQLIESQISSSNGTLLGQRARKRVVKDFNWDNVLSPLVMHLEKQPNVTDAKLERDSRRNVQVPNSPGTLKIS